LFFYVFFLLLVWLILITWSFKIFFRVKLLYLFYEIKTVVLINNLFECHALLFLLIMITIFISNRWSRIYIRNSFLIRSKVISTLILLILSFVYHLTYLTLYRVLFFHLFTATYIFTPIQQSLGYINILGNNIINTFAIFFDLKWSR
jgi:hypothetical protein